VKAVALRERRAAGNKQRSGARAGGLRPAREGQERPARKGRGLPARRGQGLPALGCTLDRRGPVGAAGPQAQPSPLLRSAEACWCRGRRARQSCLSPAGRQSAGGQPAPTLAPARAAAALWRVCAAAAGGRAGQVPGELFLLRGNPAARRPYEGFCTAAARARAGQVPGELLPAARQPRVRVDQPHIRLLRRVQTAVQHPALEDVHGLLQLPARRGAGRREGAPRAGVPGRAPKRQQRDRVRQSRSAHRLGVALPPGRARAGPARAPWTGAAARAPKQCEPGGLQPADVPDT
jgi:hypothetical protein